MSADNQVAVWRVAASFGRQLLLESPDGDLHSARAANRKLRCICGDAVTVQHSHDGVFVQSIEPRQSVLWRQDNRQEKRPVAANVDCMLILASPRPGCSPEQLDRYIAVAELCGLTPLLLRGKTDIADPAFDRMLGDFAELGYELLAIGAKSNEGLEALTQTLVGRRAVLCGLSGAGKSSLFNRLVPGAEQRVAQLSDASGEGRHTTTSALLHRMDCGGWLIDSPGVRDIRLWPMTGHELLAGFRELLPLEHGCRFKDCSHRQEPGCAVRNAVEAAQVDPRRYHSFRDLAERLESQQAGPGAGLP